MKLLKNVCLVLLALAVLVAWARYRRRSPGGGAPSAPAATEVKASAYGFAPLPAPFIGPPDKLLILAPPNCPSEAGRRADELVRQLCADGIPCSRSGTANIASSREASQAELAQLNTTMLGELPIVFIDGRARNNPDLADVESEYRSNVAR